MTAIEFTLNGTPVASDVRDDETLLDVLRERLGLTSMKDGCAPEGSCGACTVMVDGKAVVSCAQKATHVRGKEVTTLDGLARTRRDEWAHAFVASGASRFSDHPRARVLSIDSSKAEALPGVMAVVTAADAPGRLYQGDIFPDWPQFVAVGEVTRYVGDVLAAVAAKDRHTAREAAAR